MSTMTETVAAAGAGRVDGDYELQPTVHSRRPQSSVVAADSNLPIASEDGRPNGPKAPDEPPPLAKVPYLKLLGCGFSFFFSGVNDGTLGPLVPYIQNTFSIGPGEIAIIYATSFLGWFLAAFTSPFLSDGRRHVTLGRVLALGAALQLVAQALRSVPPPHLSLPLYAVSFFVQTLGMALQDAHSNTFVSGAAAAAHRWLGFIHASYAAGTLLGPPIATAIAAPGGQVLGGAWTRVYFVLLGLGALNLVGVVVGFSGDLWRRTLAVEGGPTGGTTADRASAGGGDGCTKTSVAVQDLRDLLSLRSFWLLSLFYFFELGAWFAAGGWVVEYLVKVRDGELSKMGYVPTGWNGGILLGRVLLAEPTFRLGERRMILIYSVICTALQLVFWLVPNIIASATALSIMGFLFGPFFATGVSVGSKLFPRKVRAQGLSFVFVVAQAGGALFPSLTGIIATRAGVQVLQPIVLALIIAGGLSWYLTPKVPRDTTPNE